MFTWEFVILGECCVNRLRCSMNEARWLWFSSMQIADTISVTRPILSHRNVLLKDVSCPWRVLALYAQIVEGRSFGDHLFLDQSLSFCHILYCMYIIILAKHSEFKRIWLGFPDATTRTTYRASQDILTVAVQRLYFVNNNEI